MKSTVVHVQRTGAQHYFKILKELLTLVESDKNAQPSPLIVPFILTCAAALECLLNDNIIGHTASTYGPDNYRRYAEGLISIQLRSKLDYIVPLLSNGRFELRQNTPTYNDLCRLISIRNSLMHNKTFLQEVEAEIVQQETPEVKMQMNYPTELLHLNPKTSHSDSKKFHDAVVRLNSLLEGPVAFVGNDLTSEVEP